MSRRPFALILAGILAFSTRLEAATALSNGMAAFEQHRWSEAMADFIQVLQEDPQNAKAHRYIEVITQQVALAQRQNVQRERLALLRDASQRLEADGQDNAAPLESAIRDTTQAQEKAREEHWHQQCEQARMERDLGHLLAANDLILKVLADNPSEAEAQRELSELQSRLHEALEHGNLSVEERYAYEGLYAFGQADYTTAATAWQKLRALTEQTYPGAEAGKHLRQLHVALYEQIAQGHVEEAKRQAELRDQFQHALALYQGRHYSEALEAFRQLAIREPDYPQLGTYLVQTEAAAEQDRARRLGEEKRAQIARLWQKAVDAMEHEQYGPAQDAFAQILRLDPAHSQARNYLAMVQAEAQRQHDPKAAQAHYESGLIAYASGRLDEALREWRLALRLNPQHEKAANAMAKVQKELALSRNLP